jgi:RNA polymerase sigma-70 factor (ECF subfamily)
MTSRPIPLMPVGEDTSDEELVERLVAGQQEALGPLYSRYAPFLFNLAAQTLDRTAAEDIVQDVFLSVWRKASTFEPQRGPFRPWVLQIAHYRIINELRTRSRRPQIHADPEGLLLAGVADGSPPVDEEAWRDYRRTAVRGAVASLPQPQRQALGLAFFEDLTHEQVASVLNLPLGTAKTRIRSGLLKLRRNLAPLGAGVVLIAVVSAEGIRYRMEVATQVQDDRALALLTDSTTQALRLVGGPGAGAETHAVYRGHAGFTIAVLNAEHFSAPPVGHVYRAWIEHDGVWTSLGAIKPDRSGAARLIAENQAVAVAPDAVQITVEPAAGSHSPSGPVVVAWPGP